jgi:hypothetical protein
MKLNRTPATLAAAARLLEVIAGREREELQITVTASGELAAYPAACGLREGETVIEERLEADSFGDGWESADASAVLEWIDAHCMPTVA